MTMRAFLLSREPVSGNALAILRSRTRPGWVIEPKSRRILAANKAGLAELGLRRDGANAKLDRRMPALLRLQELVRADWPEKRLRERLVFWAPRGSVSLSCDIFAPDSADEGALVVLGGAPGPAVTSDDAAILRRIARRIRAAPENAGRSKAGAGPSSNARRRKSPLEASGRRGTPKIEDARGVSMPELRRKLAHELKTPLSAIAAAAEIMKDERLGPLVDKRYRGYAAGIHETASHALSVIDRMLGAPPSGEAFPALGRIDAGAVARGVALLATPLAEKRGIRLATRLAPRLPHALADATALRQILLNLLTNALKFTSAGGTVKVEARSSGRDAISIVVRDTGCGMTAGEIALERPRRGGGAEGRRRKIKSGGHGLGLPLAHALAKAMGATLTIESTPGKGTSATVALRAVSRR